MKQKNMNENIKLKKSITWVRGSAVTIGGVLGAGILALPAVVAEMAGPASILSWILMGIFSLPMVIVIGMMSSEYPDAGGMAAYAQKGFGKFFGQVSGILVLGAIIFGMPITALIGANYIGSVFMLSSIQVYIVAGLLIFLAVFLNYRGVELSGKVQVFVVSIILVILIFTVVSSIPQVTISAFIPFAPNGYVEMGKAMNLLFFAFLGWEMVAHLSEEFYNPRKDVPLSLGVGFIIINLVYISIAFVTIGSNVYKTNNSASAMIYLITNTWGSSAGNVIAFLGLIICYCAVHTYIAGISRLIYAEAREGNFPKIFGDLHPKYKSPSVALISFVPLIILILFLSYIFNWELKMFVSIPSTTFLMVYIISMMACVKLLTSRFGKCMALISSILCAIIFVFSGKIIMYPLSIIIVTYCIKKKWNKPHEV